MVVMTIPMAASIHALTVGLFEIFGRHQREPPNVIFIDIECRPFLS